MDPVKSPQLLSTNTELVIAPKSRERRAEPAQEVVNQESATVIVRLLPKSDTQSEPSRIEISSSVALVSPLTLRTLNMQNDQHAYLQRILPPIQGLLKDIKHLQQAMGESSPKDMALKKLRDEISGKERPNREALKEDEAAPFILQSSDMIPPTHIGLLDYPESRAWDIIR
jgi:hypothetical protein